MIARRLFFHWIEPARRKFAERDAFFLSSILGGVSSLLSPCRIQGRAQSNGRNQPNLMTRINPTRSPMGARNQA
jgi:hypothetical protein